MKGMVTALTSIGTLVINLFSFGRTTHQHEHCILLVLFLLVGFLFTPEARSETTLFALFTFNGDSVGERLGFFVSGAGDVNGDGFADVIVGAHGDNNNGPSSGSARVFSGLDGTVLFIINGDSAGDQLGRSVSGAGDLNGDGFADVIVGAPFDNNKGSVSVHSGLDGSVLYPPIDGDLAGDQFGLSVSGVGDLNGDGVADVIVGAPGDDINGSNSGRVSVHSGQDGSLLYTIDGDSNGDSFGLSVSGIGDLNGDGLADVIVGAAFDSNNAPFSGSASVFSGLDGTVLFTFNGDSAGDALGLSVSGVGDLNGDGIADLIVGAPQDDNNGSSSGSARVFSGADGSVLYTFNGDSANDFFGNSVSGAGDLNGDGFADVIVGALGDANNGFNSGSATVFSGADGSVLFTFNGDSAGDLLGRSVSGAGDLNGDGLADVIVGAPDDSNNALFSGSARIFLFSPICEPADIGNNSFIGSGSSIGDNTTIGSDIIIEDDVNIGDGTFISEDVNIEEGVNIGQNANIAEDANIGEGATCGGGDSAVGETVVIGFGSTIGDNSPIGENSVIGSNVNILNGVMIGENVIIGNDVTIGNNATIGNNVTIGNGVTIGDGAIIEEGTNVTVDVP